MQPIDQHTPATIDVVHVADQAKFGLRQRRQAPAGGIAGNASHATGTRVTLSSSG